MLPSRPLPTRPIISRRALALLLALALAPAATACNSGEAKTGATIGKQLGKGATSAGGLYGGCKAAGGC